MKLVFNKNVMASLIGPLMGSTANKLDVPSIGGIYFEAKNGECTIEAGFIWADILTNIERVADHCSNIAVCIIDMAEKNLNVHESLRQIKKNSSEYLEMYNGYCAKYGIN